MKIVGLTGGIASGKTMVSDYLLSLGAPVVDADVISRRLTEPGQPALLAIAAVFGEEYLDENRRLKRKELGRLIFGDKTSRLKLNQILHPLIREAVNQELARYEKAGFPAVVLSAPLLLEGGMDRTTDEVWLVALEPEEQLRRLMARDGIDGEEGRKRLAAQSSLADKLAKAHRIIDNNGSPEATRQRVKVLWREISADNQALSRIPLTNNDK
jgi:dephospho-CoA kinase